MTIIGAEKVEIEDILPSFGWQDHSWSVLSGGLINQTYLISDKNNVKVAVLQKLHRIFDGSVNKDIGFITQHLDKAGIATPLLLKTADQRLYVEHKTGSWRALSYLEGDTFHKTPSHAHADSAGRHVGRFHNALSSLQYEFAFKRSGVHDTAKHFKHLQSMMGSSQSSWSKDADALACEILDAAKRLPSLDAALPKRICHGDLKISNLLFKPGKTEALALVDLDTMGHQTLAYELGDALRSWCNVVSENHANPEPDFNIASAFLRGFADGLAAPIKDEEIKSIAIGYETICLELAARFCIDVYEDNYFGWDDTKFSSRREQNVVRSKGQLATSRFLHMKQDEIEALCMNSFGN